MTKPTQPAVAGWFTADPEPALLGSRCTTCRTYVFPKASLSCPNPECDGSEFDEVPLSRRGRLWSWTTNHYAPPAPYVSPDPFVPYTVAAVELPEEKLVVLGQVAGGADDLAVGTEMEIVVDTLFEDDDAVHQVWKWKAVSSS
ncbi:MAG: uncharacterized protein QOJ09_1094 [Actinomycetota bacterium]|jgi:uncharacterized OB-fold protein|nr:uncharacterized protein [Actinomycetota bacterium]